MPHAHHFLARLDRVTRKTADFALGLYRDAPRMRWLLEQAKVAPGEDRVALALEHYVGSPHVVVTGSGRFVTCLGGGMGAGQLRVIPRAKIDAWNAQWDDALRRVKLAEKMIPPGKVPEDIVNLILWRPDTLSREELVAMAGWQTSLAREWFDGLIGPIQDELDGAIRMHHARGEHINDAWLVETWRNLQSAGPRMLIVAMGDLEWMDPIALTWPRDHGPTAVATRTRMIPVALRGAWAAARMGDRFLGHYERILSEPHDDVTHFDAALATTAIALRHPAHVADARRIVTRLALRDGGANSAALAVVAECVRALEDPEGAVDRAVGAGEGLYRARVAHLPKGAPFAVKRGEDVPREWALLAAIHSDGDALSPLTIHALPDVARLAEPENLHWPEAMERALRLPRTRRRAADAIARIAGPKPPPLRAVRQPGRNEPCSCGSGWKFKKCCAARAASAAA